MLMLLIWESQLKQQRATSKMAIYFSLEYYDIFNDFIIVYVI